MRKIKTWMAGWTGTLIQPPTTAPLCSAASMATLSVLTHTQLKLFLPSSLPLCEETANIKATQEVFHPRYLHAPFSKLSSWCPIMTRSTATFSLFCRELPCPRRPRANLSVPSTLAVVEDAQSSKDRNLTLDRGDHFRNTFETLEVKPEANKSQKNSNMRNTQTAWFLQLHIVKNMTQQPSPKLRRNLALHVRLELKLWHLISGIYSTISTTPAQTPSINFPLPPHRHEKKKKYIVWRRKMLDPDGFLHRSRMDIYSSCASASTLSRSVCRESREVVNLWISSVLPVLWPTISGLSYAQRMCWPTLPLVEHQASTQIHTCINTP